MEEAEGFLGGVCVREGGSLGVEVALAFAGVVAFGVFFL